MECSRILTVLPPPISTYYSNFVVDERPGTATVWNFAVFEFITMKLVCILHTNEQCVVGCQRYDPQIGQDEFRVLDLLDAGVRFRVDHHGFSSLICGCAFHAALAYQVYCRSAKIDLSSVNGVPVGFDSALQTVVYTTWSTRWFRHGIEIRPGLLGQIDSVLVLLSSGLCILRPRTAWGVLSLL